MRVASFLICSSIAVLGLHASAQQSSSAPTLDSKLFKALAARSIGPAVMGGRVSDIALDPNDSASYFAAFGRGGLMKTADDGGSFAGALDDQDVSSMGAVAISPADSKVVWAGSGEANDRNSSGWGNGVYRSTDGGGTWTHVGLEATKCIARIVPHPTDANVAFAAAMGDLWNDSAERGLYKTSDGGKTWSLVLHADGALASKVGCGDVAIDPTAPDTLYATLYARRRTPWSFTWGSDASGGQDAGGIFKSVDGGKSWKKLAGGLPANTGRIGLSVFAKNPKIVYAVVQTADGGTAGVDDIRSKRGGIFRTDDGGATWTRKNALCPRPFYFSQIRVDPLDEKRIYVLGFALAVSEDGGDTFREDRFAKIHPDCHALAIDPKDPKRLMLGTDGGLYASRDGGAHWRHVATAAMGEYYRVSVDSSDPYRIAGGLQDNLSWLGPSRTNGKDGLLNSDWINLQGGDGFYCVFDPTDSDVMFAESQEGEAHRFHIKSGAMKVLKPVPAEGQSAFRFHWNSPLIGSTTKPGTMYLAGNHVFELTDRGEHWRSISPDLSTRDVDRITTVGSGAETYGVVYALAESPLAFGTLWAGTDDGKLWVTEDDGTHWTDLTSSLPPEAKGQWIARIEPGHRDRKTAYLAVSAYRSGNYAPLLWRTDDFGRSWSSIASNLRKDGPVRVVREDPTNTDLLFVGTEFGLYASLDRGAAWFRFGELPTCAVDDLVIHPREHDLVVATHGRSLWIVDDLRALESLSADVRKEPVHLFAPKPATAFVPLPGWIDSEGTTGIFRGANPPVGAVLDLWVDQWNGEALQLEISNAAGAPLAKLTEPGTPGFHRVVWDLKPTKDFVTDYGGQGDRFVRGGEYKLKLTYGKATAEQKLEVRVAPDIETR